MKYVGLLTLFPISVFAISIPVDHFDQSKLEYVVSQIPSAFVSSQKVHDHTRKWYSYPKNESLFKINCTADYYRGSSVPSNSDCTLNLYEKNISGMVMDFKGDEYLIKVTDTQVIKDFFRMMPYTGEIRRIYSTERVLGLSYTGIQQKLFRYRFACNESYCEFTFTSKEN
jgi:hypothetical protein